MTNRIKSVAASATATPLGSNPSQRLSHLVIQPGTTTPGAVTLKDGGGTTLWTWPGGTLSDIKPFTVPLFIASNNAGFTLTTGLNVSVDAVGEF